MKNLETAYGAPPRALDEAEQPAEDTVPSFTVADFLRQVAVVLAVCLGFAVAVQLLLLVLGDS